MKAHQHVIVAWAVTMKDGKTIQEICFSEDEAKYALEHWDHNSGWGSPNYSPHQVRPLFMEQET